MMTKFKSSSGPANSNAAFDGFEPPSANFIYCPNQFFDVCIPNQPQTVVRLVAYIIDKTLGWLDDDGNPIEQDIAVSYADLITKAGISRGAVRSAIDDAVSGGFIICAATGRPNSDGVSSQKAQYRLRWNCDDGYSTDAARFRGFYTGEGYRTAVPNAFFRHVIRREPLAVIKVVSAVLRYTLGYENQFGGRRKKAPLSYSFIQRYACCGSRTTLSKAIQRAKDAGYIQCVEAGTFTPKSENRSPATYSVRWRSKANSADNGSKYGPVKFEQFKRWTSNGSETGPEERFKKWTKEKTEVNNTNKQQPAVAVEYSEANQLLIDAGFDKDIVAEISRNRGVDEIRQQIKWLPSRNVSRNPLGMLRRAIEEQWSNPESIPLQKTPQPSKRDKSESTELSIDLAVTAAEKKQRIEQQEVLNRKWRTLSNSEMKMYHEKAIAAASSDIVKHRLRCCGDLLNPPAQTLNQLAQSLNQPITSS